MAAPFPAPNFAPAVAPISVTAPARVHPPAVVLTAAPAPPAPAAPAVPPPPATTRVERIIEDIGVAFITAGCGAGICFCWRELLRTSPPGVDLVLTVIPLTCLGCLLIGIWIERFVEFLPNKFLVNMFKKNHPVNHARSAVGWFFFCFSFPGTIIMATYWAGRELRRPFQGYHIAIGLVMVLLAFLDLTFVILTIDTIWVGIKRYRRPKRDAKMRWLVAELTPRYRITKDEAEADLARDRNMV